MKLLEHKLAQLDKYNYDLSEHLCKEHAHEFDKWWDPDKFNWNYSWALAQYCFKHFNNWWDPDKFDWRDASFHLVKYCTEYFNIWWDPDKFDWRDDWALAQYCSKHFNEWWDPDKFDWSNSWALTQYCSEYFDIWWDADKFDWNDIKYLITYCVQYIDKWWRIDKFTEKVKLQVLECYNIESVIKKIYINFDDVTEVLIDLDVFKKYTKMKEDVEEIRHNIITTILILLNKYSDIRTTEQITKFLKFILGNSTKNIKLLIKLLDKTLISKLSLVLF